MRMIDESCVEMRDRSGAGDERRRKVVACLGGGTVVWTCSVHARRAVFMGRRESNCLRQERVQKAARHAWLCGDEQDGGCVATPTTGKQLGYACESQASIV